MELVLLSVTNFPQHVETDIVPIGNLEVEKPIAVEDYSLLVSKGKSLIAQMNDQYGSTVKFHSLSFYVDGITVTLKE